MLFTDSIFLRTFMNQHDKPPENDSQEQTEWDAHEIASRLQVGRFFIRALREKGWTQTQLAKVAGCSQTMVSKICSGKTKASHDMLSFLLTALELPLDSIEKLPGLGFDSGSDGFRLKILIIRALIANEIPSDGTVDAREFVMIQWENPIYRDAVQSNNLNDAVWASLVADRYFEVDDDGRYLPLPIYYDLKGNLLFYVAAIASGMSTVRNFPLKQRAKAIANFDKALLAWEESLDKPEQLAAAIDACSYSLAAGDRMLLAALLGHASALQFFLEVGASVIAGNAEHFATIVRPFFVAIHKTLQLARDQMVSDNNNPTQNIMAFLSQRIDEIFDFWKQQGMIKPENPAAEH